MLEVKYPSDKNTLVFVFDQSSCHTKYDDKDLLAKKLDGGPRRVALVEFETQDDMLPDGSAKKA